MTVSKAQGISGDSGIYCLGVCYMKLIESGCRRIVEGGELIAFSNELLS